MADARVHGLLLAAGAGRRMGRPKALVEDWLVRAVRLLRDGGCGDVTVVLGAGAEQARALLDPVNGPADPPPRIVVADDWAEGMGASLRAGLASVQEGAAPPSDAVVVTLVDLPDLVPEVVRRLVTAAAAADTTSSRSALVRASFDGVPGHPVLLGADHLPGVRAEASGDAGARAYLRRHDVTLVECGDLASGADVDRPAGPPR